MHKIKSCCVFVIHSITHGVNCYCWCFVVDLQRMVFYTFSPYGLVAAANMTRKGILVISTEWRYRNRVSFLVALMSLMLSLAAFARPGMDVMFVLDSSSSMKADAGGGASRMDLAVRAIELFAIGMTPEDRVGISGFSWETSGLQLAPAFVTDDLFERVRDRIYAEVPNGWTDILLGLRNGRDLLKDIPDDPARRKILILLTDGRIQAPSAADMVGRYGAGTQAKFGEQWRPLIARDTEWLVRSEIPVYTIVLGSESDTQRGHIDVAFGTLVSAITHGAMHWARSADDLRGIYQNLWHQLTARPIPQQRVVGDSIEVLLGDRVSEMQTVLSGSRRTGLISRLRGQQLDARFYYNNILVSDADLPDVSIRSRRGKYAVAYTILNPPAGSWRIEPKGMQADVWVDVDTWWKVEGRVLGSAQDEIDIREPITFEVAVVDKETGRPVDDEELIKQMEATGIVDPVQSDIRLHSEGRIPLEWNPAIKAFSGTYFSKAGDAINVQGEFNVMARVQFYETQDTPAHTIIIRDIPPVGRVTALPDRIHAFSTQGRKAALASVSGQGKLVKPTLYLDAPRGKRAELSIEISDLVNAADGKRIAASQIKGKRSCEVAARATVELDFAVDLPATQSAGRYVGTINVNSRTPRVTGTQLPVVLDVGGPPPSIKIHKMMEPGQKAELTTKLDVPRELLAHVKVGTVPLVGPGENQLNVSAARVAESMFRAHVEVPEDLPGGLYAGVISISAPGLAEGSAQISIDVVRHKIEPASLNFVIVPGGKGESELVVENTANEMLEYSIGIKEGSVSQGLSVEVAPRKVAAFYELPGRIAVTVSANEQIGADAEAVLQLSTPLGAVADIPVKVTAVRMQIERLSRHDTFRGPAGEASSPIEYRLTTSSPQPLRLDVVAEEWTSPEGRALNADTVLFESQGTNGAGRIEVEIAADKPATLSVRANTPAHARGNYEGRFAITSAGFSEVFQPLRLQAGAIWIEGENPLSLSDERGLWKGAIRVHSSLADPVQLVHRVEADPAVASAITVVPRANAIQPGQALAINLDVDRGRLPYGHHTAKIRLDSQGVAGTAVWEIRLSKERPGLFAAPSRLVFTDLLGGSGNLEATISTSSAEPVPVSVVVKSLSDKLPSAAVRANLAGTQVGPGRDKPLALNVTVDSRHLLPGEYEAEVSIASSDPQIEPLTLPVFIQVGGLREINLSQPTPETRYGGVRAVSGRQPSSFRLTGAIAGRMDLQTLHKTYRISVSLLDSGGKSQALEVDSVPVTSASHEPEWMVSVPALRPGHYRLQVKAENINLASVMAYEEAFYVLPQMDARLASGGLAGFPIRFEGAVNPDDLSGVSEFHAKIILAGPGQNRREVLLKDDGEGGDALAGDGIYTGSYLLPSDQLGRWTWDAVHTYRIGEQDFAITHSNDFIVDAGLWIKGARLSRRDPSALELNRFVSGFSRKFDWRLQVGAAGDIPVELTWGGAKVIGDDNALPAVESIETVSLRMQASMNNPALGTFVLKTANRQSKGLHSAMLTVKTGDAASITVPVDFNIILLSWWQKVLALIAGVVTLLLLVRKMFSFGELGLRSTDDEDEFISFDVYCPNSLIPRAEINLADIFASRGIENGPVSFVRLPFLPGRVFFKSLDRESRAEIGDVEKISGILKLMECISLSGLEYKLAVIDEDRFDWTTAVSWGALTVAVIVVFAVVLVIGWM